MSNKVLYSAAFAAALIATATAQTPQPTIPTEITEIVEGVDDLFSPIRDVFDGIVDTVTGLNPIGNWKLMCAPTSQLVDVEYGTDVTALVTSEVLKPCFVTGADRLPTSLQDFLETDFSIDSLIDTEYGIGCQYQCTSGSPDGAPTGSISRSYVCVEENDGEYAVGCGTITGRFIDIVRKMTDILNEGLNNVTDEVCNGVEVTCGDAELLCPVTGIVPAPGDTIPAWSSWDLTSVLSFLPREECNGIALCAQPNAFSCVDGAARVGNGQVCVRAMNYTLPLIDQLPVGYWVAEPSECTEQATSLPYEEACPVLSRFFTVDCAGTAPRLVPRTELNDNDGSVNGPCGGNGTGGGCCKTEKQTIIIDEVESAQNTVIVVNGDISDLPPSDPIEPIDPTEPVEEDPEPLVNRSEAIVGVITRTL